MDVQMPNFEGFTERLLSPYQRVELVPHEIIDCGLTMQLVPSRNGKRLDCNRVDLSTLPSFSLVGAGIGNNQEREEIFACVREHLKGRTFIVKPRFDFLRAVSMAPEICRCINELITAMANVERSRPFFDVLGPDPITRLETKLNKIYSETSVEFSIVNNGKEIDNLNIIGPVRGFMLAITDFLVPWNVLEMDGPEMKAVRAAAAFHTVDFATRQAEEKLERYTTKNSKWWFRLLNNRRSLEQRLASCRRLLASTISKSNEALAALPA